ncbi:MAG: TRAP transporter large permease [Limimaricola soesokkakensis]|uniref:TRAP transporter large permease protein n=1 Tax=Limimaricola soesokkakensis TaxID=1343159 RepID=A0A1X6ZC83_9RHOB|nr:TRAP transporter large permease [Limimaricola soesokkakensis]PSK86358.1 tripartite ATP-independent transporter DctM subunit [Limimaricola soesokkakensis]SLN47200.1 Sialic acid TRAP transporter permease protein SiaT [Limimaricola soesokkakensis]
MISALILILALTLIVIGMPVAFAIGIAGTAYFLLPGTFLPDSTAVQRIVAASQSFPLLAVPLFILLGNLMNSSGITPRLVGLATVIAGWMRGGLAQSTLILSALMGGVSGSAVADAAMQARILGEPMVEKGYDRGFTAALLAIGGLITATLPPSLGLILYGYLGEVSIGRLFIAGIVPGMLLLVVLMVATWGVARQRDYKPETERLPTLREVGHELWRSFWAVLFPVWLLIGIRFGFFTPSEAGAFAVAYALIIGTLIYRELDAAKILDAMVQSLRDIGMIMLIILFSGTFGYVITFERVPQSIAEVALTALSDPTVLLFVIAGFLMVLGMLVEATVLVMLLTPILVPVVTAAGIDPVHFGLVMMTLVTFGGMTPPVGVSMFTVCGILRCSYRDYSIQMLPLVAAVLGLVTLMILFPGLVMFLPNWLM